MSLTSELLRIGIIEAKDVTHLENLLIDSNDHLRSLYRFFESKVLERPDNAIVLMDMHLPDDKGQYSKIDAERYLALLNILKDHDLILDGTFKKLNEYPLKDGKLGYFGAFHFASVLNQFYANFSTEKQLEFVTLLTYNDSYAWPLLSDERKSELINDIKAGKLETYLDVFKYCNGCSLIKSNEYKAGEEAGFLKALCDIVNELTYGTFTILHIKHEEKQLSGNLMFEEDEQGIITIDTGSHHHTHTYTYSINNDNDNSKLNLLLDELLQFINKLLADYSASYRLTTISSILDGVLFANVKNVLVICRVEQANKKAFNDFDVRNYFLRVSPLYSFWPVLSYIHIQYAIHHFKVSGILSHLSDAEIDKVMSIIYQSSYESIGDLLSMFPDIIAITNRFNLNNSKPYAALLNDLNKISKGVLHFTDIVDYTPEVTNDIISHDTSLKVSFSCNGVQHEYASEEHYAFFDDNFMHYIIKQIVRKEYPNYELVELMGGASNNDLYMFTSKEQSLYLNKMKLRSIINRF